MAKWNAKKQSTGKKGKEDGSSSTMNQIKPSTNVLINILFLVLGLTCARGVYVGIYYGFGDNYYGGADYLHGVCGVQEQL